MAINPPPGPPNTPGRFSGPPAPKRIPAREISIRTMRDDLSTLKGTQPRPAATLPPVGEKSVPVNKQGITLPLPAKPMDTLPAPSGASEKQAPVAQLPARPRSASKVIAFLVVLLVVVSAAGAGVWWWLGQTEVVQQTPTVTPPVTRQLQAAEVLPEGSALIVRYSLRDPQDRLQIEQAWAGVTEGGSGVADLVAGNPTLLLADTSITEFFYIILDSEPRPYVVVPKTSTTTTLFSQSRLVQVTEIGQWLIVHPLDTDKYTALLETGSVSSAGGLPGVPESSTIQWIFDQEFLQNIHPDAELAGDFMPDGETVVLNSSVDSQAQRLLFTTSTAGTFIPAPATPSLAQVADVIPGDATFVFVGQSLAADLPHWKTGAGTFIDATVLDSPSVKQFLDQLTGPYGYYERQGADGVTDLGLVVALPLPLKQTISTPDTALETALRALIPPIVGRFGLSPTVFNDNTHAGIPLRYTNILGNTQALDYAATEDYVLIASSKEGMFALIDSAVGNVASIKDSPPWQAIVETESLALGGEETLLQSITYAPLIKLLPVPEENAFLGISPRAFGTSQELQGTIFFGTK